MSDPSMTNATAPAPSSNSAPVSPLDDLWNAFTGVGEYAAVHAALLREAVIHALAAQREVETGKAADWGLSTQPLPDGKAPGTPDTAPSPSPSPAPATAPSAINATSGASEISAPQTISTSTSPPIVPIVIPHPLDAPAEGNPRILGGPSRPMVPMWRALGAAPRSIEDYIPVTYGPNLHSVFHNQDMALGALKNILANGQIEKDNFVPLNWRNKIIEYNNNFFKPSSDQFPRPNKNNPKIIITADDDISEGADEVMLGHALRRYEAGIAGPVDMGILRQKGLISEEELDAFEGEYLANESIGSNSNNLKQGAAPQNSTSNTLPKVGPGDTQPTASDINSSKTGPEPPWADPSKQTNNAAPFVKRGPLIDKDGGYKVYFQTTIKRDPSKSWSLDVHNEDANDELLTEMEADPEYEQFMRDNGINLKRKPSGKAPDDPPEGFTWHHSATEKDVIQLVERSPHKGSEWWKRFHPANKGGFWLWKPE